MTSYMNLALYLLTKTEVSIESHIISLCCCPASWAQSPARFR